MRVSLAHCSNSSSSPTRIIETIQYRNVAVNVYHGQAPLLTIYDGERYEGESLLESRDKWTVRETHFLHEYETKEDINDMMLERG